jgi:hypothetical protein
MRVRRHAAVTVLGAAALAGGCGGSSALPAPTATVSLITVEGTAPAVGSTVPFTATATLSSGATQVVTTQAVWSSSNQSVATVTSAGVVAGVAAGEADVVATYQGASGRSHVTIVDRRSTFTLAGRLTDATSGGVLPNIAIEVTDAAGRRSSAVTTAAGTFSIGGLAGGAATVSASATSYRPSQTSVVLTQDTSVEIVLQRVVCVFTLTPSTFSIGGSGGTGTVAVASGAAGCVWEAKSGSAFITVTSGASGTDAGSVGFSVAANGGAARVGTLTIAGQTVSVSQDAAPLVLTAAYDAAFATPACNEIGSGCDSGTLLAGRAGTEVHSPNTLFNSCPDGSAPATGLAVIASIRVATIDGTVLAPGKTVRIDITGFGSTADALRVYLAADVTNPVWTLVGSTAGFFGGSLSVQAVLPAGRVQAIRVNDAFGAPFGPGPCATGSDADNDDLVFRVQQ